MTTVAHPPTLKIGTGRICNIHPAYWVGVHVWGIERHDHRIAPVGVRRVPCRWLPAPLAGSLTCFLIISLDFGQSDFRLHGVSVIFDGVVGRDMGCLFRVAELCGRIVEAVEFVDNGVIAGLEDPGNGGGV